MGLRMATPWRHPSSGIYWLRRRIPSDLVALAGKREEKISLRTRDPAEAKAAYVQAAAEVETRWANLRQGVQTLSHKQTVALAGEYYRMIVASGEDNPPPAEYLRGERLRDTLVSAFDTLAVQALDETPPEGVRPVERLRQGAVHHRRTEIQRFLLDKGIRVSPESLGQIAEVVTAGAGQARDQLIRYGQGDYRPDPAADRFPKLELARKKAKPADTDKAADFYDLKAIYEKLANERKHSMATRKKWSAIIAEVALVHADIRTITDDWCIEWKDGLLARGLTARSVQYGYLAALRSTCAWAVTNRRIAENPVDGISVKVGKAKKERPKGYTDNEAAWVLGLTRKPIEGRLSAENKSARRWVPWICAYTGARVGEISQLRREDVQQKDGIWLFWITPEAGTVKDNNSRHVAVHPDLIEQGFLAFVEKSKPGPLFFSESRRRGGSPKNPTSKKVGERIAAWIRAEGFTDKRVAPNHAWRHRFKTLARRHQIDAGTRDYMQGHVSQNDAEEYGEFEPAVLLTEISKLPAYRLGNEGPEQG
jgi:integrase